MLEQTQNSAPVAPEVVTAMDYGQSQKSKRWQDATWSAQADAQNQLNMAKYNNDYNYWLWQQQTAYNSPEQQVARLKAAGLNPNFNSIEGAGNASSPAPSSGKLQSNFLGAYQAEISSRAQRLNEINSIVSAFNDLVKNVGQGFNMARTYSQTPSGVSSYRSALHDLLIWNRNKAGSEAGIKDIQHRVLSLIASGNRDNNSLYGDYPLQNPLVLAQLGLLSGQSKSGELKQADLELKQTVNEIKQYYHDNIQPAERQRLENQAELILSQAGYIDTQNEYYVELKRAGIAGPLLIALIKQLF